MVMTPEQALSQMGVTTETLCAEERHLLDERGYVILSDLYDKALLSQLQTAFETIAAGERQGAGGRESGTRHPHDLLNHEQAFLQACLHPKILAAAHHVLRRAFRLTQCEGRDPLPGYGQQGLHTDWMPRTNHEPFYVTTAICLLDDFTPKNGATRLVPGTHRLYGTVPKAVADPARHHPEEIIVTGKAGSVLVFNGHLWHSGTQNTSQHSRRAVQCVFHAQETLPPSAQCIHRQPDSLPPAIRCFLQTN